MIDTYQIVIVCLTALMACFIWCLVRFNCEITKRMAIISQERVYNIVRKSNADAINAIHNHHHESWCDSLDGKSCNCHAK